MPTEQLGDLEMAGQRKKQTSFDITNYAPAQKGLQQSSPSIGELSQPAQQVPGNIDRARRMQAQFDQPVSKGIPPGGIASGLAGAEGVGAARQTSFDITNTPAVQRQAGIKPGLPAAGGSIPDAVPSSSRPLSISDGLELSPATRQQSEDWYRTGIGADRPGGKIVGRRGAGGGMEFTNQAAAPGSASSAQSMPSGGMGSIGDGIGGGLSVGDPGDAQLAFDRYERASQERQRMVEISQRGELGNNGGRLTIVQDSSRSPTLADRQRARFDERQANTELTRQRTQQSILAGLDARMTGQLERQRLQQEMQAGDLAIDREQALGGILAGLNDPNLQGEARTQAERSYLLQAAPSAYASLSNKGANPLSAPVQRLEDDDLSAIGSAQTMNSELARIDKQIASGELNLGLLANAKSVALNAIGAGDQNARNYASLNSTLEKLRNESLRLNTGVQTEGDAQRAWNELVTNLKSPDLVRQRLAEISALNERAIAIRSGIINNRRVGQGAAPLDVDSVLGREAPRSAQSRPASAGGPIPIESDSDYEALPSGAVFVAPDGTTRRKP